MTMISIVVLIIDNPFTPTKLNKKFKSLAYIKKKQYLCIEIENDPKRRINLNAFFSFFCVTDRFVGIVGSIVTESLTI